MLPPIVLLFLVDLVIVAPLTGWLANQKGRSPSGWFVAAVIGGPLALLTVGLAPTLWSVEEARRLDRRCPRCDSRTSSLARFCSSCDGELPAAPDPTAEPAMTRSTAPDTEGAPDPTPRRARAAAMKTIAPSVPPPTPRAVDPEPSAAAPIVRPMDSHATPATPPADAEEEPVGHDLSERRGVANIASGVFAGGVSELGAGYRYLISTSPTMLYVSGPIDVAPTRIVFQSPRSTVDASHFEGDLVIVAESPIGRKRQLVFRGIAGADAAKVEALLARQADPDPAPLPAVEAAPQPAAEAAPLPAAEAAPQPAVEAAPEVARKVAAAPVRRPRRTSKPSG